MIDYFIIDSTEKWVGKLSGELSSDAVEFINPLKYDNPQNIAEAILNRLYPDTKILICAEALVKIKPADIHAVLETVFWLRCQHQKKNPIIIYSLLSLPAILQSRPEYFILSAPGCRILTLPLTSHQIKLIAETKPLEEWYQIRPFLKPMVDSIVSVIRHRLANYIAMALMLNIVKQVYNISEDTEILKTSCDEFYNLRQSLWSAILTQYFDFTQHTTLNEATRQRYAIKSDKKVLLVDDLAEKGWCPILSQMIYGNPDASEIKSLPIAETPEKQFDETQTCNNLSEQIKSHKPHVILLDLRLNDEEGKKVLNDLGGYKLLKFLKKSAEFRGIPIIIFTASSNTQTIKELMRQGADYVWTKPGIDEELRREQVLGRYGELKTILTEVFEEAGTSALAALNNGEKSGKKIRFEDLRNLLLQKTGYIKYRCELLGLKKAAHHFNTFTDIFIDTNVLMSGTFYGNASNVDFAETILNVYKLCQICTTTKHILDINGVNTEFLTPKVITINFVLDEIIEQSKLIDDDQPKSWKRALLGYSVIRSQFENGNIRTEFNHLGKAGVPKMEMNRIPTKHYADPVIRDMILEIVSMKSFFVKQGNIRVSTKYKTPGLNVLLICNENPYTGEQHKKLPFQLDRAYRALSSPKGKMSIYRLTEFNERMNKIIL